MAEPPRDAAVNSEIARPVLVLVRDLIFSSRIAATARAANVPITLLRDPAQLAAAPAAARLIVDLNLPGALDAAVAWKNSAPSPDPARTVIGFVSHVDADTIARARAAGVDQVLPRSRFVEMLPTLLTEPARPY